MDPKTYSNPLSERYASEEIRYVFSAEYKFRAWRRLWTALAEAQAELGLPITARQLAALRRNIDNIDYAAARRQERKVRHDVMSHVYAFGLAAPEAKGVIHLGATSCFVTDNAEVMQMRDALQIVLGRLAAALGALAKFMLRHRSLPTLGFTHYQPAQPTTVGKRAALWAQDILQDIGEIEHQLATLAFRGVKGTTGTQASFLQLFDGNARKVELLEKKVCKKMNMQNVWPVTGQTYPRKQDYRVLAALSGIGQTAHRIANDIRLLMNLKEIEEPFEKGQIGSSAMAYKRNPMRSERITALARYLISLPINAAMTAGEQWFERTLDDSANRRIVISQAFLAADAIAVVLENVLSGLVVYPKMIRRNLDRELPFMATENILMEAVRAGGDRQALHERIRIHSRAAGQAVKNGGENDLIERIALDPAFAKIRRSIRGMLDPKNFIGLADRQVAAFEREHVRPTLRRIAKFRLGPGRLNV